MYYYYYCSFKEILILETKRKKERTIVFHSKFIGKSICMIERQENVSDGKVVH